MTVFERIARFSRSISTRLQLATIFLSAVGVLFGIKSYLHVQDTFGVEQSLKFWHDILIQLGIAVVINIVVGALIYETITKPLKILTNTLVELTNGKYDSEVPYVALGNEIGSIARKAKVFREKGIRMKEMEAEQELIKQKAEVDKKNAMNQMADNFEASVKGVVAEVAASVEAMQSNIESVAHIAEDTKKRSAIVSKTSSQAAENSSHVAAATEELTASIREISVQTQKSSQVVHDATSKAEFAKDAIHQLSDKSMRVGEIIQVITDIAGQINLLALNATIESARAGEAGKGFAVVANEVKNLANLVGKATDEITHQITEMQQATKNSVDSVMDIIQSINQVSVSTSTVATAVEEQSAVTNEISSNVVRTSEGTKEISNTISSVQEGAEKTGVTALQVLDASKKLSDQFSSLRQRVEEFLQTIRTA